MAKQDLNPPQREPRPDAAYWANRDSAQTDDQREAAFQRYLESTVNYFAAIQANGGKPWFGSEDERRDLYMRRYTRPRPPSGLTIPDTTRRKAA